MPWICSLKRPGPHGTDLGLGIEARTRALLGEGEAAERHCREAIDQLGRTRHRPELARAHLLYGEWLRRQRRRRDARDQLRTAFSMFDAMGMDAFAGRARAELRAAGERARPRGPEAQSVLTAQEEQIARLVAEHLSNRDRRSAVHQRQHVDITRKIFRKLGVTSWYSRRTARPRSDTWRDGGELRRARHGCGCRPRRRVWTRQAMA